MSKTKKIIPDESIFRDRDKEARFWEKNFNKVWVNSKSIKVKFVKTHQ